MGGPSKAARGPRREGLANRVISLRLLNAQPVARRFEGWGWGGAGGAAGGRASGRHSPCLVAVEALANNEGSEVVRVRVSTSVK